MEPIRFGMYTVLGSIPFAVALIYAGTILRSNWTVVATDLAYLNYPIIALVAFGVVFLALQVAGVLRPGWPPRWVRRKGLPEGTGDTTSRP
jgi:membrane protein DedA with SNARE-associated domain